MTKKKNKTSALSYINPLFWIKMFFSYLMTGLLVVNHYFVLLLICLIMTLTVLFFYDRYAFSTYDKDYDSLYSGTFASTKAYHSPLAKGDKDLSKDLSSYYASQRDVVEKSQKEAQKSNIKEEQEHPYVWDRQDDVSRSFIQQEVRRRLADIEKNVVRTKKRK